MKIVAFMQEPWFLEGVELAVIEKYRDKQVFHQKALRRTMSGNRLLTAFGEELFEKIWWDNANWRPNWMQQNPPSPDYDYMDRIVKSQEPQLILGFGTVAKDAVRTIASKSNDSHWQVPVLFCHHPNARHRTQAELDEFAMGVRRKMLEFELLGRDVPHILRPLERDEA